ncbi:(3S,6E)-nerolidol synthase 1-like isoform X2 [Amaranthus tricolor]|uniref:(3S,6E)-nerolidol synthase 1-like isoform X2 n=1 Tax=Amaranthus tricolor TaxID=29722 RepID=UPI00258CA1C8|nr:(3S,6E)-nerolidol synthase 1-like isoform X2 [Amaranthus tricolor]
MVKAILMAATIFPTISTITMAIGTKLRNGNSMTKYSNQLRCDDIPQSPALLLDRPVIKLHSPISTKENELEHQVQKIRGLMKRKASDYVEMEELVMIDAVQRLGLEDYFEEEIIFVLERLYAKFYSLQDVDHGLNYHELALSFRLLRHQGYYLTADIFEKLKDKDGKLKEEVGKDLKSLLSIFECCQLETVEEDEEEICGEVKDIIGQLLETSMNTIEEEQKARLIDNTLRNPCHKNVARLSASPFLQDFSFSLEFLHDFSNLKDPWIYEVQELARIDFDIARMNYRTELHQISKWGKELNLEDMNFARIEPLKWCMWSLGVFPGPNMSQHRLELAKAVSFIYIIDDIFDSHDSYHQLHQFTQAIHRWEYGDVEQLPKSMKVCFKALQDTTHDFSSKIKRKFGWDPQPYLQKLWAEQLRCYLVEAKWRFTKYSPSPEEYLNNAIITSGTHVVLAHAFFLLGHGINNNSLHDFINLPSIVSSTATILRLWNDTGIHTDKTPDGSDHSYIDYYMKEEKTRSSKSARHHINGVISEAWNCLNREYMSSDCVFSRDFKLACLNLARMVPIMYNNHQRCHLHFLLMKNK